MKKIALVLLVILTASLWLSNMGTSYDKHDVTYITERLKESRNQMWKGW